LWYPLLYRMQDAWCQFLHPTLILWQTSSSIISSFCSIDHKCWKVSFLNTTWPFILTSLSCVVVSKSHFMYSVLVLPSQTFDLRVEREIGSHLFLNDFGGWISQHKLLDKLVCSRLYVLQVPKVQHKPIKSPRKGSNKKEQKKPKTALVWRTGLSGVLLDSVRAPPDSVRCTRVNPLELLSFGFLKMALRYNSLDCPV
jgi:hypothetical protein